MLETAILMIVLFPFIKICLIFDQMHNIKMNELVRKCLLTGARLFHIFFPLLYS